MRSVAVSDDSFTFAFGAACDNRLPLSGAVVKYAQLGGSVTLNAPAVTGPGPHYYTWYFRGKAIARHSSLGFTSTEGKHFFSYAASSHKKLSIIE